jgi:nicotinamidase-related amidase
VVKTLVNPMNEFLDTSRPLKIDAGNTALIVVDMQFFDAHRDWGEGLTAKRLGVEQYFEEYFEQIDAIIPRIQKLLALFRLKEMEVFHIRVSEVTEDSRDVGRKQLVRGFVVPKGSCEAEFLEELQPIDDEIIINKSSSGVFPVTNLDRLLRNMGITTLIFAGTSTNGCVESAVRDAVDLGYDVIMVSDACAAGTVEAHERALACLEGVLTRVLATQEVFDRIAELEAGNRGARSGLERVKPYLPQPPDDDSGADQDPYESILPPALVKEISSTDTALLLVDFQRLTCDPHVGLGAAAEVSGSLDALAGYYGRVQQAQKEAEKLLAACRSTGLPVIHVRTAGRLPDGRDLGRKLQAQGFVFGPRSAEAEFLTALAPIEGEVILDKPASGVFTGTGLDELLRNLEIENLILAGISYDGAIEGSVRSISDRGYGLFLAPDACATHLQALQDWLWEVESGVIEVKSTEALIAQIEALQPAEKGER